MPPALSPFAPESLPHLPPLAGVKLGVVNCGIRYKARPDLLVVALPEGTQAAGVLTRSLASSAPVDWCREILAEPLSARLLIVNSGNANAFTGKRGVETVQMVAAAAAQVAGCVPQEVYQASTGVIGEPLPHEKIIGALPALVEGLSETAWHDAAKAIMTTDTFPKAATRTARIGDVTVTINGIAKGSGMIAPDMATMLSFVFTDANLPADVLQTLLSRYTETTFNSITVDSDTSTSDTLLLFATGTAKNTAPTNADAPELAEFREALHAVLHELAMLVIKDGEGITKLVEIQVAGAADDLAAKRIALSIANSPLVKTAVAGEDANWGRIVAAIGKAGERADRDKLVIHLGDVEAACEGMVSPRYSEERATTHMKGREILIRADVGIAQGRATVWTCDLTHGYIDINGSYRS